MKSSDTLAALAPAFAKAQGAIEGAMKDKTNPAFRSKYADLGACWDACRDELTRNGLSVIQAPQPCEDGVTIVTRLLHASGEWIEDGGLHLPATKKDAQGFGSAMTYARRYALCAMVGIAPEDDDGNAASKRKPEQAIPNISPTAGVLESMNPEEQQFIRDLADQVMAAWGKSETAAGACEVLARNKLEAEEKTALWSLLPSNVRSAIKKHTQEAKA